MPKQCFIVLLLLMSVNTFSQKIVTISGKIIGLGNSKIYLGNKPNGVSRGFNYIKYDSVNSINDSFEFRNFRFKEVAFYSIQVEGSQAWLPFLIDEGHIYINAKKDSIYKGKISGSSENDQDFFYRKKLAYPFYEVSQPNFDSMDKYRNIDTFRFMHYFELNKKLEGMYLVQREKFIKKYPDKFVSLIILNDIQKQMSDDSLQYFFNLLSPQLQNNSKAVGLKCRIRDFTKNTRAGTTVPNFILLDINGNENYLYNIHAPFKLIIFWASWCGPCLAELPELKDFHSKNKNVSIISFSIDYDKSSWIKASKGNEIPWYSFSDSKGPEGRFASYFSVQQIPLIVLLDANNKIIKYDVEMSELKNYIERK